jgi:hypothetical protein
MKKIILTAVMVFTFSYAGLIDFSFAEDFAKGISELTGAEMAEENTPMIFAQEKSTTGNYEFQDPYNTKKVEEEEDEEEEDEEIEEEDDDNGAGVGLERRKDRRKKKAIKK